MLKKNLKRMLNSCLVFGAFKLFFFFLFIFFFFFEFSFFVSFFQFSIDSIGVLTKP